MVKKKHGWDVFIHIFLGIAAFLSIALLLMVVIVSISNEADVVNEGFKVIPENVDFSAYNYIFQDLGIIGWRAIWSFFLALTVPIPTIVCSFMLAYTLTKSKFRLGSIWTKVLIASQFCSAGMVATYYIYTRIYNLGNNPLIYYLPHVNLWGVMLYRTFIKGIPDALIESAEIDGASEIQVIRHIILPMSKSMIGIQFFQSAINTWNNYTTSLIYMDTNKTFQTIAHYTQNILQDTKLLKMALQQAGFPTSGIPETTMKYAMCVVGLLPIFLIFPLVQKYFSKGIAVGAVKG